MFKRRWSSGFLVFKGTGMKGSKRPLLRSISTVLGLAVIVTLGLNLVSRVTKNEGLSSQNNQTSNSNVRNGDGSKVLGATDNSKVGKVLGLIDDVTKSELIIRIPTIYKSLVETTQLRVLEDLNIDQDLIVVGDSTFNGNSIFNGNLTVGGVVAGTITADNVIYSLSAGDGISVTTGQTPVITNDDAGSAQSIFKKIKTGDDTIEADGNSDTLEFVAGDGISLSANTDDDKITITSSSTIWTTSGTNVYLSTTTNNVGIGTISPSSRLHVVGSTNLEGNTEIGGSSSDTITFTGRIANGTSLLPDTNLGSDLGSPTNKFNNIYSANLSLDSGITSSGQVLATYNPTDTSFSEATIRVNVTTPDANEQMLGIGVAGYQRASIDEDGDLIIGYSGNTSVPTTDNPLMVYNHGSTNVASIDISGNIAGNRIRTSGNEANSIAGVSISGANLTVHSAGSSNIGLIIKADSAAQSGNLFEIRNSSSANLIALGPTGGAIFNEQGNDADFRVEGVGETNALHIRGSDGNVGIGAEATAAKFHITATNAGDRIFALTNSPSGQMWGLRPLSAGLAIEDIVSSTNPIFIEKATPTDTLYLDSTGNIGIGTSSPEDKLEINGGNIRISSGSNWYRFTDDFNSHTNPFFELTVNGGSTAWYREYYRSNPTNNWGHGIVYNVDISDNYGFTFAGGRFSIGGRSSTDPIHFQVNTEGLIGIGTTSPTSKLHLSGAVTGKALSIFDETGDQDIFTASASGSTKFVISNSGNVGIGTTAPSAKLELSDTQSVLRLHSTDTTVSDGETLNSIEFYSDAPNGQGAGVKAAIRHIGNQNWSKLDFYTSRTSNDVFAMRINELGKVGIGDTDPTNGGLVVAAGVTIGTDSTDNLIDDATNGAGSATLYLGQNTIDTTAPSDRRLKDNIVGTNLSLSNILGLEVVDFNYKASFSNDSDVLHHGLIAQDVISSYSYAVKERSDGYLMVEYNKFIPLLIKGVQEQQLQIDALGGTGVGTVADRLADLETRVLGLETATSSASLLPSDLDNYLSKSELSAFAKLSINMWEFVSDVTFNGKVLFNNRVEFADKDLAGYALISANTQEVRIDFEQAYDSTPLVQVTPLGSYDVKYWVSDVSQSGFTIKLSATLAEDANFSWLAISIKDAKTYGNSPVVVPTPTVLPTTSPTPSATPVLDPSPVATESGNI